MIRILGGMYLLLMAQAALGQTAIYVEKQGNGETVLYLPGFTSPGSVWSETIENLDSEYENHIVSYAGFNGLAPIKMPWYDAIKNELIVYIEEENLQNLTLVGHSMGGNLAIDISISLSERITGLVLVETIPSIRELMMPGVPQDAIRFDSPYNNRLLSMSNVEFTIMAEGMVQNMALNFEKHDELTQWIVASDRETYVYGYTELLMMDQRDRLEEVKIDTLIIGAPFPDRELVLRNYETQYENLNAKTISIANAGKHFIMLDSPDWYYEQVNSYFEKSR